MGAKPVSRPERFYVGDQVERRDTLPFRRKLRKGLQGTVVCTGLEVGWLTVPFPGYPRPRQGDDDGRR
jgi:hypothetical protein